MDGRVFRTRSSYTEHLKRRHGQYWNKRWWIGFIGRPASRRLRDTPRSPPPPPCVAPQDIVAEASPPRAAAAGVSSPRAAEREASPPRFADGGEVWSPRAAEAGASLPRSAPATAMDAPSQLAATAFPPTGTGIPANIGVLPPPVIAAVGSVVL